jgi:hypothetical protein
MFFKKKKEEPIDPKMMPAFHANGGYGKNLDVMAWQLGWQVAKQTKEDNPAKSFQDLYYGGGSPFAFDEKTFNLAWEVAKKN